MGRDDRQVVTGIDDGWRPIDENAPKDGYCLIANEEKTMAWESYNGAGWQPLADVKPHWWKPGRGDGGMV